MNEIAKAIIDFIIKWLQTEVTMIVLHHIKVYKIKTSTKWMSFQGFSETYQAGFNINAGLTSKLFRCGF